MIAMPSILGQTSAAAQTTLRTAGFQPGKHHFEQWPVRDDRDEGNVCTQQYSSRTKEPKNTTVDFTLYKQGTASVPPCQSADADQLPRQSMTAPGSRSPWWPENNPAPENQVLSTDPTAYATVSPGATITINVSTGKVAIPNEVNKAVADATSDLSTQGWAR